MFKKIKECIIDIISDNSGHINSKIIMGFISFIIASILAFIGADHIYVGMFLTYSAGAFGWSCFDNNSAFKFNRIETKTSTSKTNTTVDIEKITNNVLKKFDKKNK